MRVVKNFFILRVFKILFWCRRYTEFRNKFGVPRVCHHFPIKNCCVWDLNSKELLLILRAFKLLLWCQRCRELRNKFGVLRVCHRFPCVWGITGDEFILEVYICNTCCWSVVGVCFGSCAFSVTVGGVLRRDHRFTKIACASCLAAKSHMVETAFGLG